MSKMAKFGVSMSGIEICNKEFSRAKVHVCYAGKNRNGSYFSKETLDEMAKSIYGSPLVGSYEDGEFQGHGGKIEITDNGMEFINTTVPYGFVDPTTPVAYEKVKEIDGITENEYLTCYVYMWHGRYPELQTVLENGAKQSMEINVEDGEWNEEGDYFEIKKGNFSALCILQAVEPCFESSTISTKYSTGTKEEMMEVFKKYTLENLKKEEGEDMEDNKEFETEEVVEEVAPEVEETEEKTEEPVEETQEEEVAEEETEDFEAKYNELQEKYCAIVEELSNVKSDFEAIKVERDDLASFKASIISEQEKVEKEELFEQFNELKGFEGYEELVEESKELAPKDLKCKLLMMLGEKALQGKKPNKKEKQYSAIEVERKEVKLTPAQLRYGIDVK